MSKMTYEIGDRFYTRPVILETETGSIQVKGVLIVVFLYLRFHFEFSIF